MFNLTISDVEPTRKMRGGRWIAKALPLLLSAAALVAPVRAAKIELIQYDATAGTALVYIEGRITDGDAQRYISLDSTLRHRDPNIRITVGLNSSGGDELAAEALVLYGFRPNPPNTMVVTGERCASACVLLLMSGRRKVVFAGARVGVHSVIEGDNPDSVGARAVTTDMARMLADRGVAADVVGRLVTTAPGAIYWLTGDELQRSGVTIGPKLPAVAGFH